MPRADPLNGKKANGKTKGFGHRMQHLLDDLKRGVDISEELARLWKRPIPPAKPAFSRADSLSLANSIVTLADRNSVVSIRAYHEAIKELRNISPFLQPAKCTHPMAHAAHVISILQTSHRNHFVSSLKRGIATTNQGTLSIGVSKSKRDLPHLSLKKSIPRLMLI